MKPRIIYIGTAIVLFILFLCYAGNEYSSFRKNPYLSSFGSYVGKLLSFVTGKASYAWPVGETVKMRGKSAPVVLENLPAAGKNLLKIKGNFELFSKGVSPDYISYRVIVNYKQVFYEEGFCSSKNIFSVDKLIPFEHPKEGIANITIALVGIGGNGKWLNEGEIIIPKDFKIEVE